MPVIIEEVGPQPAPPPTAEARASETAAAERVLRLAALRQEREARLAPP